MAFKNNLYEVIEFMLIPLKKWYSNLWKFYIFQINSGPGEALHSDLKKKKCKIYITMFLDVCVCVCV